MPLVRAGHPDAETEVRSFRFPPPPRGRCGRPPKRTPANGYTSAPSAKAKASKIEHGTFDVGVAEQNLAAARARHEKFKHHILGGVGEEFFREITCAQPPAADNGHDPAGRNFGRGGTWLGSLARRGRFRRRAGQGSCDTADLANRGFPIVPRPATGTDDRHQLHWRACRHAPIAVALEGPRAARGGSRRNWDSIYAIQTVG